MKRILVIEDDAAVRSLIVETIRLKGWEPIDAADGEAGLGLALAESPDLILCDIQMPKLDGYGVLHGIRENKATAALPFIFLTGLGEKPKMRKGMESGADDYVVKPFTVPELIAAIDARFQKQTVFQETTETRLNELRESLTFALPHELVTPLNTILGFSELLVDTPDISRDQVKEYAGTMRESAERLRGLIEKFLVYAQVELTAADRNRDEVTRNVPHSTEETISATASRVASERKRQDDLKLTLSPVSHRISPSHLDRIVRELVENACKFSEPGMPVKVESIGSNGTLGIRFQDEGRGFSPEQIKHVGANIQFDRRLHEQQGTGLGLAIARRLTEIYGGAFHIQSAPDAGTSIIIEFPA